MYPKDVKDLTQEQYEMLLDDHNFLECLNEAGINNADAYEYGQEIYNDRYPEKDETDGSFV